MWLPAGLLALELGAVCLDSFGGSGYQPGSLGTSKCQEQEAAEEKEKARPILCWAERAFQAKSYLRKCRGNQEPTLPGVPLP